MARQRPNAPTSAKPRRARGDAADRPSPARTRPRDPSAGRGDLTDEELRALLDDNVDPDEVARAARDADADAVEQEASDHDRDTARDRLEGLLLERDDEF